VSCAQSQQELAGINTDSGVVPPWQLSPYRLIDWLEMNEFQMDTIQLVWQLIAEVKLRHKPRPPSGDPTFNPPQYYQLSEDQRIEMARAFGFMSNHLRLVGLTNSAQAVMDIQPELTATRHGVPFSNQNAVDRVGEIERAIKRELKANVFFYMSADRASIYREPMKRWETVVGRFPDAVTDIEECAKCLACDRCAGAVFHVMLVAEHGVIEIGNLIGVKDPKINFASVVSEMQRIVHRTKFPDLTAAQKKHHPFIVQTLPLIESMQKAWRNKISHATGSPLILKTGDVSPSLAKDIVDATQAFMRRLAADLPRNSDLAISR
jgi:hypothetical protein